MKIKLLALTFGILFGLPSAYATCGTQSGNSYTLTVDSSTSCEPPSGTTSVTVDPNVTLTGSGNPSPKAGVYIGTTLDLGSLTNYGTIRDNQTNRTVAVYVGNQNGGSIGTLNNQQSGTIQGVWYGITVDYPASSIGTINNRGLISGLYTGVENFGHISTINNFGTFSQTSAAYGAGIRNDGNYGGGAIGTIVNNESGVVSGNLAGISNLRGGVIQTITNFGSITAISGFGIDNTGGTLPTLNNAQGAGNAAGALTYKGNLPANYNVILKDATTYGKLIAQSVSGTTIFGISTLSVKGSAALGSYASIITGISNTQLGISGSSKTGTSNGYGYTLTERVATVGSEVWDLLISSAPDPIPVGPNAANTLQTVQLNASGLSSLYNQQAAAYQAALSYDCQVYDQAGLCVSVGGRYTYAGPSPSSNQQAGLVVIGYKPVQTLRVGAFADQSVNVTTPNGFKQNNNSPMWGLFAKWHLNKDETGLGVQASAVTSSSTLNVSRTQLENTEAGSGTTQFNGQGYQLTTNYHQPVTDATSVVPYVGLRYTRINAGAYNENQSATVTSPLSYNAMAQSTFSAIGGVGVRSHLAEKLIGTASVGIQQNLNYSMANYAGTSTIAGLESFSVAMPGNVNSMATASAGLYYNVRKNERVGVNVLWQEQPFIATNTTTALATYTIGF